MPPEETTKTDETLKKVIEKVNEADSILVTLSKDPTVDEMTAALGLTMMLGNYGKHATAIYSGKTPNALEFLRPDETFEANTNSLQDFIIALNKDKADHLRYKIEGDFVKVYITPYKTTISESDLEFSRGEVNVDLVIALDVVETEDLDAALSQHGRIMHNASLINISNTAPGRLGGIEWSNPHTSSVSEMIVMLLEQMGQPITKEVATALLTGIIAATERFSNERTTPDTMALASKLMQLGADQQLIVAQMAEALDGGLKKQTEIQDEGEFGMQTSEQMNMNSVPEEPKKDDGLLNITHEEELTPEEQLEKMIKGDTLPEVNTGAIMEELKNAKPEESESVPVVETSVTTAPVVETSKEELPTLGVSNISEFAPAITPVEPEHNDLGVAAIPQSKVEANTIYGIDSDRTMMQDKTMVPLEERPKDYGAMMDEALAEQPVNPAVMAAPVAPAMPEAPVMNNMNMSLVEPVEPSMPEVQPPTQTQPVMEAQPMVNAQPMTGGVELPPPPAPDASMPMPPVAPETPEIPAMPEVVTTPEASTMPEVQDESAAQLDRTTPTGVQVQAEPVNPVVVQPEQNSAPISDPSAFRIPGM